MNCLIALPSEMVASTCKYFKTMTKISVNFCIDSDLLANLETHAAQTGCTVMELIEKFCQQGLGTAPEGSISVDARPHKSKDNLLTRVDAVETDVKSMLERLSVLESKVDVDVDVEEYLQNWQNSLELKIASLIDTLAEKRVEELLGSAGRLAEAGQPAQAVFASDTKSAFISTRAIPDDYQIDSEYDDEPYEILTDFLEPDPATAKPSHSVEIDP